MRRETVGLEDGSERVDVLLLIADSVSLGVRWTSSDAPGVVVGDVGDETAYRCWGTSVLVELGEELCRRRDVGSPA